MKLIATYIDDDGYRILVFPKLAPIKIDKYTCLKGMKEFLLQIMEALSVMHKFGIAHGDIHFNNILQSNDDKLILADYGCSSFCKKLFYKDFADLGLCLLKLLRLHLHVNNMFACELLDAIRDKCKGNRYLLEACNCAEIMINCKEATINKVVMHTFLKKEVERDENLLQGCVSNVAAVPTTKPTKIPRKPLTALNVNQIV